MRALQHLLSRLGVIVVSVSRGEVDGGKLPPLERVVEPFPKPLLLLFLVCAQPVFEQQNAVIDEHFLERRDLAQELLDLLVGGEAHHLFDTRAIVPAAVEQHDLARRRQMRDVALEIPLARFGFGGLAERNDMALARVELFGHRADRPALARRIASLKQHDDPLTGLLCPAGHRHQLFAHGLQRGFVFLAFHLKHLPICMAPVKRLNSALWLH